MARRILLVTLFFISVALLRATQGSTATSPPGFEQLRKIDVHSHIYEDLPVVNAMLRRINLRVVNISNPGRMAISTSCTASTPRS